ncbi:helix-turn-helix domain-containing protein [Corynebacterium freiburgense]|uniref:helix-turn-helix domain-containing protein n=1 Tax=Corynebacterium freiburgense TaxID=556548 RepID=UPI0005519AAF|nr:helix-turn-helix domain-containing protein [Corynebacterium freiburgense]
MRRKLLTTSEVAKKLKISRQAVLFRVKSGKLIPVGQLPHHGPYLFDAEEIENLAAEVAA